MPRATAVTIPVMSEWIYFLHPPRDDFAATMTAAEQESWGAHAERLQRMLADGVVILAGPTLGRVNTGINIFEADDEESARRIMQEDGPGHRQRLRPRRAAPVPGRLPAGPRVTSFRLTSGMRRP